MFFFLCLDGAAYAYVGVDVEACIDVEANNSTCRCSNSHQGKVSPCEGELGATEQASHPPSPQRPWFYSSRLGSLT
jgi:hypothetical protein